MRPARCLTVGKSNALDARLTRPPGQRPKRPLRAVAGSRNTNEEGVTMARANRFSLRQYHEVKNGEYTIISFERGRRVLTYSRCSMYEAMQEAMRQSKVGRVVMIYPAGEEPHRGMAWDLTDYIK